MGDGPKAAASLGADRRAAASVGANRCVQRPLGDGPKAAEAESREPAGSREPGIGAVDGRRRRTEGGGGGSREPGAGNRCRAVDGRRGDDGPKAAEAGVGSRE